MTNLEWQEQARCASLTVAESDYYFFEKRGTHKVAKQLFCDYCPVQKKCLEYALSLGDDERSFMAGTSYSQRVKIRNARILESQRVNQAPTGYQTLAEQLAALLSG